MKLMMLFVLAVKVSFVVVSASSLLLLLVVNVGVRGGVVADVVRGAVVGCVCC